MVVVVVVETNYSVKLKLKLNNNQMVNDLLKRAVSNAFRHGLNLKPGRLNSANGNCVWESIIYNMLYREYSKNKTKETSKQLRTRSLNLPQTEVQWLPFIESNTTEAEWNHIKQDTIHETKLGDICLVASARAIKKSPTDIQHKQNHLNSTPDIDRSIRL